MSQILKLKKREYFYLTFLFLIIAGMIHLFSAAKTEDIVELSNNNECIKARVISYPKIIHTLTLMQIANQCSSDEETQEQKQETLRFIGN